MGEYGLGIDLGTRYTAAAITAGGAVEAVRLGGRRAEIPSMVFRRADGELLIGEAARRRGESAPGPLVDDLRARLTEPDGPALIGQFLAQVVATACRGRAGALGHVVLTDPAAGDSGDLLRAAAGLAGLSSVTLVSEALAAAARARPGAVVAVYDLGATFSATVLRRTDSGADVLATERVDGVDFDRMLFDQVLAGLEYEADDPAAAAGLARLRRECAEAVESLSFDTETEIAVDLPGLHTRVPVRRSELEKLISPTLAETVAALRRTFETASVRPEDADAVVLAGGSARIPLVGALVSAAIGRSVPPGEQPELAVAMGAARLSLSGADQAISVAFPAIARPLFPPVSSAPVVSPALPTSAASGDAPTTSVRPAIDIDPPTQLVAVRRRRRIWTYRWPIAVGLAGVLVAVAVTAAALRPRGSPSPPAPDPPSATPVALLWKTPTGSGSTEPPAVSADRIVLGTADGQLRGYRRDDGLLSWSVAVGAGVRPASGIPGRRAYASTADGRLVAVDTTTGKVAWQRSTLTRFDAPPVVGAGRVYAGGRDGVLYAYELGGSHSRWRVWADDRISLSPALVGTVAVLAADDGRLYGTDRYGSPMWKPSVGKPAASPVAAADAVCLPLRDGSVRCARVADGSLLPSIASAGVTLTTVAGGAGLVFAAGVDGSVGAWDPISGQERWSYRPAGTGGAGHLLMRTGEIDVAYPGGRVVGLDAGTGAERWQYATDDRLDTAPSGDDHGIFVLGAAGMLYALRPPGVAAAFGSAPTVAPSPTTRPAVLPPPHHRTPRAGHASEPSGSPSDSSSGPPSSEPPVSVPASGRPEVGAR